jgi:hypothetical protein
VRQPSDLINVLLVQGTNFCLFILGRIAVLIVSINEQSGLQKSSNLQCSLTFFCLLEAKINMS